MSIYGRYEALSPIYKGGLTNHLPMMLIALKESNVNEERIIELCNKYRDERAIFDLSNQASPVGDFEQEYINRTSHYLSEINHKGKDIVVGMFLNERVDAISSALFHGVIRLAYALKSNEDIQLAQALAYFELVSVDVHLEGYSISVKEFKQKVESLRENMEDYNYQFKSARTMQKFSELTELDVIKSNLVQIDFNTINREVILDVLLTRYLESNDFYVLHLITGFHALLELEEFYIYFREVLQQFVLVSQVFMMLNPIKNDYHENSEIRFSEIMKHIGSLEDAHKIKLLYSLSELYKLMYNEKIIYIGKQIIEKE